ncbi:MAG: hypothetical protein M3Y87_21805, partial [Myxococcota bacterium]|nr:hypothetical protein [Myxococcota bacterium]
FHLAPLRELAPGPEPTLILANPPYGVRLDPGALWREIADARPRLRGHRLGLLLQAPPPRGALPEPHAAHRMFNGALECRLVLWDL